MAKFPTVIKKTCSKCNTSTEFKLKQIKKGKQRPHCYSSRNKARRGNRGHIGKYQKVPTSKVKKSKWPWLLITCKECGVSKNLQRRRTSKVIVKAKT
jgi:ribosomal protein L44E